MTMTNAQAALMATATWFSDTPHLVTETALHTAELFKNWLDQQDAKELQDFDKGRPEQPMVYDRANLAAVLRSECPNCRAKPGQPCVTQGGSTLMYHHTERKAKRPSSAGHPEQHDPKKHVSTNPGLWGRIT